MPNDLLDLSLEQVNAVVAGYQDRELDLECHCILTGYYAGYYMGAKKPKKPAELIKKLIRGRDKILNRQTTSSKTEPDIEFFQAMESKLAKYRLEEMMKSND